MAVKTIHIVPSDEAWIVKEPGRPAGSADVQKSHSRSDLGTKAIRDGVTAVIRERSAGTTKRAHRDARKGRFHRLARGGRFDSNLLEEAHASKNWSYCIKRVRVPPNDESIIGKLPASFNREFALYRRVRVGAEVCALENAASPGHPGKFLLQFGA
jgi:hypothetical protein